MNNITRLLTGVALLALASWSVAQEPEIVHVVNFPKGNAAWTVSFASAAKPPATAPTVEKPPVERVKVDIVRQGNLRRDIVSLSDGGTTQIWWLQNPPVALFNNGNQVSSMVASAMAQQRYDESSLDWIEAKTFLGMNPYRGKRAQYYETEMVVDNGGGPEKRTLRAWIDSDTHKPIALDNGFVRVLFSFQDAIPAEPLRMPPDFLDKSRRLQAFYAPPRRVGN